MININDFCDRLLNGFVEYFQERKSLNLLTQSKESCKAIIKKCIEVEPDYVLEIGTNYGLSTLSFAYAMTILGKPLSDMTTTDISHDHWISETPDIQRTLLSDAGIKPTNIRIVTEDFAKLNPYDLIRRGKALVFYDIHDTDKTSYMRIFLNDWIPLFDYGHIMVHDCYPIGTAFWIDRNNPEMPVSSAKLSSGFELEGYGECRPLVEWLNNSERRVQILPETSILTFTI